MLPERALCSAQRRAPPTCSRVAGPFFPSERLPYTRNGMEQLGQAVLRSSLAGTGTWNVQRPLETRQDTSNLRKYLYECPASSSSVRMLAKCDLHQGVNHASTRGPGSLILTWCTPFRHTLSPRSPPPVRCRFAFEPHTLLLAQSCWGWCTPISQRTSECH